MTNNKFSNKKEGPSRARCIQEGLAALLLMTVFSQSLFTLVRRNLMTLPFFSTRHNYTNDLVKQFF